MRPPVVPPVLLVAGMVLLGCRSPGSQAAVADSAAALGGGGAAAAAPASEGAGAVTITATDFAFDAPAEIPAGVTTFRLVSRGPSLHHVQLIRLDEGKTVEDFLAALKAGGPPPRWATPAGGPNPPETGDTAVATLDMQPGNYALLCFIPSADGMPHFMKGMVRSLQVTGTSAASAPEPSADMVVTLSDYDFKFSQPLAAGRHVIKVENAGPQPHEIAIVRLAPGKDPKQFADWAEHPTGPQPGTMKGGVSAIMPGSHAFVQVDLEPGEYGVICFIPDGKDGQSHYKHGMMKRMTVN